MPAPILFLALLPIAAMSTGQLVILLIIITTATGASAGTIGWFLSKLSVKKRIKVLNSIIKKLEERLRKAEGDFQKGKKEAMALIRKLESRIQEMRDLKRAAEAAG